MTRVYFDNAATTQKPQSVTLPKVLRDNAGKVKLGRSPVSLTGPTNAPN